MSRLYTTEGNVISGVIGAICAFSFTPLADLVFPYVVVALVAGTLLGATRLLWLALTTPDRPLTLVEQRVADLYRERPGASRAEELEVIRQYHNEPTGAWRWHA